MKSKRYRAARSQTKKRSLFQKIILFLFSPLLTIGLWYGFCLLMYQILLYISDHFQIYSRYAYIILCGFLYSGLALALMTPLWIYWKVLRNKKLRLFHWQPLLLAFLFTTPVCIFAGRQAYQEVEKKTAIIAHRAVNHNNAVENTVEAVHLTSKDRPDFIEVDVYETADFQFVSFHDDTLVYRTGLNKIPHDLTLNELTQLTVTSPETKQVATIASFDAILAEAKKQHQKILIDFKTSKADSPQIVDNFLKKYENEINKEGHQLQSSDPAFMKKILAHSPAFKTFLITSVPPEADLKDLTGYSVPLPSLTEAFLFYIVQHNKTVYVWTINDTGSVNESEYLAVDAIITDNLSQTRDDLEQIKRYRNYLRLFYERLYYLHVVHTL